MENNIDVTECIHYTGNLTYLQNKDWTCRAATFNTKCEDNDGCYFKRLKYKEEECEELTKERDNWESLCKHADKQIDELQDEIKNLNIEIDKVKSSASSTLLKQIDKFKIIEEEIKAAMSDYCFSDAYEDIEGCCICYERDECMYYKILKTIKG